MPPESRTLIDALIGAYPDYVRSKVTDVPEAVIQEGQDWLGGSLEKLLELAFPEQRRGPLEIFQEAMKFPTGWLEEQGAEPPHHRDPAKAAALPGDTYDLAPASSQELGEAVWRAHLAWGAAKAAAITRR